MKQTVIAISLFLLVLQLKAQTTFSLLLSNELNELPSGILELSNNNFLLSYNSAIPNQSFNQTFMLLDQNGNCISNLNIVDQAASCMIKEMYQINDSTIIGIGSWEYVDQDVDLWILCLDTQMNKRWEKKYKTRFLHFLNLNSLIKNDGNFITASTMQNNQMDPTSFLFFEFSSSGDSISSKYLNNPFWGNIVFDIQQFENNYKLPAMGFNSTTNTMGQILSFDSLFNLNQVDSIPEGVSNCCTMKYDTDSTYFLAGNKYVPFSDNGTDIAIIHQNQHNFNLGVSIFGKSGDTNDYGGYLQSLDYLVKSNIYVGGTSNQYIQGNFSTDKSWFVLSSYDSLLNLHWTKFYGGDAYYTLNGITATSDKGCIMYGCRYDYLTQDQEKDLLVIKVNDEGIYTGIEDTLSKSYDAIVYPNPGIDYLVIKSGSQINGAHFILSDSQGQSVIKENINNTTLKLNTSNLDSGIYLWQIVFRNKVIESGKWVRN
jgi:hypothetical protein